MKKPGYLPIEEVQRPNGSAGEYVTGWLSMRDYQQAYKYNSFKLALLPVMRDTLKAPERIVRARRLVDGDDDVGWCYIGRPDHIPLAQGQRWRKGSELVTVFVSDQMVIWEWRIEQSDGGDPPMPFGATYRFGETVFGLE